MKKFFLFLALIMPIYVFAWSTIDLWHWWTLENAENNNFRGSTLYYNNSQVYYFRICTEQENICDAITSGLKAWKNGVFVEYFQWGGMDPGIYRITKNGSFVWQNTDQKNICSTVSGTCQYQGFSVYSSTKLKLSYIQNWKKKYKLITIK